MASGDTKAVVPGPMVTLVMITKSLGSAISVEQFVLLAPAAGKRGHNELSRAHCWLIVLIMSPKGLIINNELFTMRYLFIMKLIVPRFHTHHGT